MQTQSLSVIDLVLHASLFVQFILIVLVGMACVALFILGQKYYHFRMLKKRVKEFGNVFWRQDMLLEQLHEYYQTKSEVISIERIFRDGFSEYRQFNGSVDYPESILRNCRQIMEAAMTREISAQEKGLSILATIASVAPYIGLLGTVYGIMNSFIAIGGADSASTSIASVAPGIAEALIATAMGLFAAISSVLTYNYFIVASESLQVEYETFIEDFTSMLQRHIIKAQIQKQQQQHSQVYRR